MQGSYPSGGKGLLNVGDSGKLGKNDVLFRNSEDNVRIPMDENLFNEGKKAFEEKGGIIIQDVDGDMYLDARNADAATINEHTIIFRSGSPPTLSEFHEELIHVSQFEQGLVSSITLVKCEIEAKELLIKNQKTYGITNSENAKTKQQLEELLNLYAKEILD